MEKEKKCNCTEECDCGCQEGKECTCDEECNCGCQEDKKCNCEDTKEKKKKQKKKKETDELKEKIKELEEKSLRDKAELINYRKRKDEEVAKMLKYANEDLIKELLPTVDNFERAIKMDDDNLEDEVSKFLSGFKMIYSNLALILQNYEVKAIDGANKPFDPVYHDAVMTEKREDMDPGQVIEVLQKGYMYKDKVIRPAMVKVSE